MQLWSKKADGKDVFYETPGHIKSYYSNYNTQRYAANTINNNINIWVNLKKHGQNQGRAITAVLALDPEEFNAPIQPSPAVNLSPALLATQQQ